MADSIWAHLSSARIHLISDMTLHCIKLDWYVDRKPPSHLFTRSNRIMSQKVCKTYFKMVELLTVFFFKENVSFSVEIIIDYVRPRLIERPWRLQLMANMSFDTNAAHQSGEPVAVLKTWDRKKKTLFSHPQHNLLRWEGRCEAMAEGQSIMTLLYPSDSPFHRACISIFQLPVW